MDFTKLTIKDLHKGLIDNDFSAVELCDFYLSKIQEKEKSIDAFLQIDIEGAKQQAKDIDKKISKREELGSLAGIPCAIKDAILVKGLNCTAGSKILENYKAVYDATCVDKLKKQDAIILGKTNLDEFAMGSSTEHSAFKITKNPHDLTKVPGGTSGGSAACVASGEAVFALGSDTGGSIRQPASFCGVVGLKPTYGAVSRYGLIAHASSLDQIGPMAKNAEDCEEVFKVIMGLDQKDETSFQADKIAQATNLKIEGLKIGVPKEFFGEGLENKTKEIIEGVIKKLETAGAIIADISLPNIPHALPAYYIISTSEASANLARFDGIRYGYSGIRNQELGIKDLFEVYSKTRGKGFGDEVKRRIMLGTFALSSGYYDAYYLKAKKIQALIKKDFENAFSKVDFILTPTSPFPAFNIAEKIDDPLKMYLSDIYTVPVNLAGVPALSMPVGFDRYLPVGLQIIGRHFSDLVILQLAKIIEKL
ncbi:MAG: Asp-tRNA(Asn)/Glu-tRNA(Gln) amidotransferase subunit GatA [Candidatus Pacebacteria bacterium]|nr:Asp-tRNA(Asn)/Glu-tRNA(Gln) amidotransferase subunit GatA [Candidatus Paceibacterota bacterium]